jgi:hypothetical protein
METVMSHTQTGTATWLVNAPFYSTVQGKSRDPNSDKDFAKLRQICSCDQNVQKNDKALRSGDCSKLAR